jgi:PAS domain S-box-containing protein
MQKKANNQEEPPPRGHRADELKSRLAELGCLYGTEQLLADASAPPATVLQGVVDLLAHAGSTAHPCFAAVEIDNDYFKSHEYSRQHVARIYDICERQKATGHLYIGWRNAGSGLPRIPPEKDELYTAVADRIGRYFERRHADEQLRVVHDELRKLSEAVTRSGSGIFITDTEGRIEYVNPRFEDMSGCRSDHVLGQSSPMISSIIKDEGIWKHLCKGGSWRGDFQTHRDNGDPYWIHLTLSPVVNDAAARVTHLIGVQDDITDRKEAEMLRAAIFSISSEIAGCHTQDQICRVVVEGIRERMGLDRCGLFLGDPDRPPFKGTYGTDLDGQTTEEHERTWYISQKVNFQEIFADQPYRTGFPLGEPDARPGEEDLTSSLIALRRQGRVFGVISVDNRMSRRPMTDTQLYHIALLSEVLGNALQTAHTQRELEVSIDRLQRANRELEIFNQAMVGRENRIIELKKQINSLLAESQRPARYPEIWESSFVGSPSSAIFAQPAVTPQKGRT